MPVSHRSRKPIYNLLLFCNNGEQIDITDASALQYSIKNDISVAEINGSVLTVNTDNVVVNITAEVAGFSANTSIEVLNEVVMISNITHFDVGIGDTFSGVSRKQSSCEDCGTIVQ